MATSPCSSRRWSAVTAELIAGMLRDPQFGPTVMLGLGGILAEAIADVVFRPAPIDELDGPRDDRPAGHAAAARRVPRRGAGRSPRLGRRPGGARSRAGPTSRRGQRRREPADRRRRRPAGRRRRPRRVGTRTRRRPRVGPAATVGGAVPGAFRATWGAGHRCLDASREVRLRLAAQPPGQRLPGSRLRHQPAGRGGARHPHRGRHRRAAGGRDRPRLRVHAGGGQPRPVASLRGEGRAGGVPDVGRLRRSGGGGAPGGGRAGGAGRRARDPARWAERPGRRQHPGLVVRPDRRPLPAGRAHRCGQPERQLRLQLPELRQGHRCRHQPAPCPPATQRPSPLPTTSTTTPPTPPPLSAWPTSRGSPTAERCSTGCGQAADRQPLVLVKGGATEGGARAAASHTGALAADDKVFDGACRAAGITRAATVEEAFEAAATFATQPAPTGPNVVVLTTAGGWGSSPPTPSPVMAISACSCCPTTCGPPSTSCCRRAGAATTRSTAPGARPATPSRRCMRRIAEHPDVHAIVYIGIGIQSNQARMIRDGPFFPGHGLDRIVEYHERQDASLRGRCRRAEPGDGQADPHGHGAGRRRPGERRTGGRAGQRAVVLPERQPRRRRAGPPVPRRPASEPAPAVSDRDGRRLHPVVVITLLARPGGRAGGTLAMGGGPCRRGSRAAGSRAADSGGSADHAADVVPPPARRPGA